jgi:HEAT repeat protein
MRPVDRTFVSLPRAPKKTQPISSHADATKPVVPSWVAARIVDLDDSDARVRNGAQTALGKIGPEDLPAIFGLIQAQQHKSFRVRAAVGTILARLAPVAVATLLKLFARSDLHIEKDVEALLSNAGRVAKAQLAEAVKTRRQQNARFRRLSGNGKEDTSAQRKRAALIRAKGKRGGKNKAPKGGKKALRKKAK